MDAKESAKSIVQKKKVEETYREIERGDTFEFKRRFIKKPYFNPF